MRDRELEIPILLTPAQTAKLIGCSLATVYRRIQRGEIKCTPGVGNKRIYGDQFFSRQREDRIEEMRKIVQMGAKKESLQAPQQQT